MHDLSQNTLISVKPFFSVLCIENGQEMSDNKFIKQDYSLIVHPVHN